MSNKHPAILLVGAGGYGRVYMDYMWKHDIGAELVGICDITLSWSGIFRRLPRIMCRFIRALTHFIGKTVRIWLCWFRRFISIRI